MKSLPKYEKIRLKELLEELRNRYFDVQQVNAVLNENLYDLADGLDKRIAYLEKLISENKKINGTSRR